MRHLLGTTILLTILFGALPALAISVEEVPNPRHDDGWVSDVAEVIPNQIEDRINQKLDRLEADLGHEVAVVTVDRVDAPTPKDFATRLFNHWGIGKADRDNGLLVLLVQGERRLEMETGYGTEEVLTDGWLKRMQTDKMVPQFKQGRFGRGIEAGIDSSIAKLRGEPSGVGTSASGGTPVRGAPAGTTPLNPSSPNDGGGFPWLFFISIGAGGAALVGGKIYKYRKDRTCPECDLRMTQLSETADDEYLDEGEELEEALGSVDYIVMECEQCDFDRILRDSKWFSGYSRCPQCNYKTRSVDTETIRHATTTSTGRKRITEDCANCSYHHVRTVTIPRKTSSSSSGSSGGGFSSGGGSSFGGGSSGGGGAGSSW